ncbi:MAG: hypothetical protein GU343_02725 [Nanoarchaeota archaeon]|jgi:hypothetical protein|nr:hypothetical protein [Nanoarchaeota archaeon]
MIPNSLDKIILHILEPTIEAGIELSNISHEQKSEKEKILNEYSKKIESKISSFQSHELHIDDDSLVLILDDLLWYCSTRFNVKCSDKEIDKKYKTGKLSGYLYLDELQYRLGFVMIENRFHTLYEQAYDKHGKVKDPEAEKMFKIYSTLLQKTSQFHSLREILYRQIGQLYIRDLYERGILKETLEGYIILTDHPEVQKVMKMFYRY